jgi:hypothetical protein
MDDRKLNAACQQIYRRFPEMQDVTPRVQSYGEGGDSYLLIFQAHATTANGKTINRIVRAVVNGQGKLVKVTTSRG